MSRVWRVVLSGLGLLACPGTGELDPAEMGRRVYAAYCTACHHTDPRQDGTLGPAVAGSSYALLEARILRAEYPPGYPPKRDTQLMLAQPHLESQLAALTAYLEPLQDE